MSETRLGKGSIAEYNQQKLLRRGAVASRQAHLSYKDNRNETFAILWLDHLKASFGSAAHGARKLLGKLRSEPLDCSSERFCKATTLQAQGAGRRGGTNLDS